MIIDVILKLNSNAKVTVKGDDIDTCEIIWHDGNPTNITKEQIKAQIPIVEQEIADAETQKETDASTGKQKLKDLGLNDAEIKALIGV